MSENKHISKKYFFEILEKRLRSYEEAILGTRNIFGMKHTMMISLLHNIEKIKCLDSRSNFFGSGFWGYGINKICNGDEEYFHQDVEVIRRIGGFSKHGEEYRKLLPLIFKVEKNALFVSTFSIDSCSVDFISDINKKYELKDFQNARIKTHKNAIYVEFSFTGAKNPISFQIDTYHFGGYNLCGGQLANYYIDGITEFANKVPISETVLSKSLDLDFLTDFIKGIKNLHAQDIHALVSLILKIKLKNTNRHFDIFFKIGLLQRDTLPFLNQKKGMEELI